MTIEQISREKGLDILKKMSNRLGEEKGPVSPIILKAMEGTISDVYDKILKDAGINLEYEEQAYFLEGRCIEGGGEFGEKSLCIGGKSIPLKVALQMFYSSLHKSLKGKDLRLKDLDLKNEDKESIIEEIIKQAALDMKLLSDSQVGKPREDENEEQEIEGIYTESRFKGLVRLKDILDEETYKLLLENERLPHILETKPTTDDIEDCPNTSAVKKLLEANLRDASRITSTPIKEEGETSVDLLIETYKTYPGFVVEMIPSKEFVIFLENKDLLNRAIDLYRKDIKLFHALRYNNLLMDTLMDDNIEDLTYNKKLENIKYLLDNKNGKNILNLLILNDNNLFNILENTQTIDSLCLLYNSLSIAFEMLAMNINIHKIVKNVEIDDIIEFYNSNIDVLEKIKNNINLHHMLKTEESRTETVKIVNSYHKSIFILNNTVNPLDIIENDTVKKNLSKIEDNFNDGEKNAFTCHPYSLLRNPSILSILADNEKVRIANKLEAENSALFSIIYENPNISEILESDTVLYIDLNNIDKDRYNLENIKKDGIEDLFVEQKVENIAL